MQNRKCASTNGFRPKMSASLASGPKTVNGKAMACESDPRALSRAVRTSRNAKQDVSEAEGASRRATGVHSTSPAMPCNQVRYDSFSGMGISPRPGDCSRTPQGTHVPIQLSVPCIKHEACHPAGLPRPTRARPGRARTTAIPGGARRPGSPRTRTQALFGPAHSSFHFA